MSKIDLSLNGTVKLENSELTEFSGGCFAYDVGWAIGAIWHGASRNFLGMALAVSKYDTHEH